jgi:hypothetical protein
MGRHFSTSVSRLVRRDGPVPHHAGGVPQSSAHCVPTIFADYVDQRLLCLAPLRLGTLDELAALVRDRNDPDTLVSAGPAVDQLVPLQRSERPGNAGPIHDHVTAKRRNRQLLFNTDQAKQRELRDVQPCIAQSPRLVVGFRHRSSQIRPRRLARAPAIAVADCASRPHTYPQVRGRRCTTTPRSCPRDAAEDCL